MTEYTSKLKPGNENCGTTSSNLFPVSVRPLCLCGEILLETFSPQRHRGRTETQKIRNQDTTDANAK